METANTVKRSLLYLFNFTPSADCCCFSWYLFLEFLQPILFHINKFSEFHSSWCQVFMSEYLRYFIQCWLQPFLAVVWLFMGDVSPLMNMTCRVQNVCGDEGDTRYKIVISHGKQCRTQKNDKWWLRLRRDIESLAIVAFAAWYIILGIIAQSLALLLLCFCQVGVPLKLKNLG